MKQKIRPPAIFPVSGSPTFRRTWPVLFMICAWMFLGTCQAQELTPRAYWPAPYGTQVLTLGYAYQSGDIITDPSLPVAGVDSSINSGVLAYQKTLGWFGRTTNLQIEVPWSSGSTSGEVEGLPARRSFSGMGDMAVTLGVNLLGAPRMSVQEFGAFRADPQPILAASIKVVVPTGEYFSDRLINIGTNRWAARARLGYVLPLRQRWALETSAGVWFFEDNDEFLGATRGQKPIGAIDVSLIRRFRPGFWGSLDLNYYFGGRTYIDGEPSDNLQRNSRFGVTVVYPFQGLGALRAYYTTGVTTRSGSDFRTFGLSWLLVFR